VRYSRKTKEQYVMTEIKTDGKPKATGWSAKYIDGKWVEDIPKPKKKVAKKKTVVKKKATVKDK
jgi:DNA topoisomerase-1